jgi:hypothetical protein
VPGKSRDDLKAGFEYGPLQVVIFKRKVSDEGITVSSRFLIITGSVSKEATINHYRTDETSVAFKRPNKKGHDLSGP